MATPTVACLPSKILSIFCRIGSRDCALESPKAKSSTNNIVLNFMYSLMVSSGQRLAWSSKINEANQGIKNL
jgi:hypothetical protein